jgi:hypothetical protein
MVVGLNELEVDVSWIEVRFDNLCGLIIHDVQLWLITLGFEVFEVLLVCV